MKKFKSLLFIPGNKENMLNKAISLKPDAFIPDMEDSVPHDQKIIALELIKSELGKLAQTKIPIIPRLNALSSKFIKNEIKNLTSDQIYGFTIGKIRTVDDIKYLDALISAEEEKKEMVPGKVKIIPWLESAEAAINAKDIASCCSRLVAIAFGGEDFAQDLGIQRSDDEIDLEYPRQMISLAARAANIYAIDTPYFSYKDHTGLVDNIKYVKNLGFKGKFAIHPSQIDLINKGFSPSSKEISYAEEVVRIFEIALKEGHGSTSLNGKVIDIPVYKRAKDILALLS
jgi:citrate lyase subunit beta/citryl-CoA lyase